jgi:hypothetical protein
MVMDKRERRSVRRIAWVLLAACAFGMAYLVVARHAPQWIRRSRTFDFYLRKASRIEAGTPVWVNGMVAGKVIAMDPWVVRATDVGGKPEEGKVFGIRVRCRILSPFHRLLRKDSRVEIVATSLFGGMRVNVVPGAPGSPRAPDGDVLREKTDRGIEGLIEDLGDRIAAIDRNRAVIEVSLEAIDKDTQEMEANFSKGANTLHAFLDAEGDRKGVEDAVNRLNEKSKPLQASFESIAADVARLDRDAIERVRLDSREATRGVEEAEDREKRFTVAYRALLPRMQEVQDAAGVVLKKVKAFDADFKDFLKVKNAVIPEVLAAWRVVQRELIRAALPRIKLAAREDPNADEVLEHIGRARQPPPKKEIGK